MNTALSAIAEREPDPRFMPAIPTAWADHGNGVVEEVPLVTREILGQAGTEAIYLVCQQMELRGRFDAETKEELIELIFARAEQGNPPADLLPPPITPAAPLTARQKRQGRSFKRQVKEARRDARRTHGAN